MVSKSGKKQRLEATCEATYRVEKGGWSLAEATDAGTGFVRARTRLEIQGSPKFGFNLIMLPDGLMAADSWCADLDDAFESAEDMFGVSRDSWTKVEEP